MKRFILKIGGTVIDAFILLGFFLILVASLVAYKLSSTWLDGLFVATLIALGGLGFLFFLSFCIYLLMDIRETLKNINQKIKD